MPAFKPWTPVRFNTQTARDLSTKIAPPYDVLDEGPKQALLARDPHNIVAIDLPVTPPKTVGPDEAYADAAKVYRQWLSDGVLVRDDQPAVVAYEQVYEVNGKTMKRRGLFATLGVEPFNRRGGGIFRHEMTIAGGIGDRTKLMAATEAQLSPIFGIFPDPRKRVASILEPFFEKQDPDYFGTTDDGTTHRCWLVRDTGIIATLTEFFGPTDVFIADGHHRYTTALDFSKTHAQLPGASHCLFVLVAAEDPGMIVLPTHRVLTGLQGFSMGKLATVVQQRQDLRIVQDAEKARFGLFDPDTGRLAGLDTVGDDVLADVLPDKPAVWRQLDVAVLHELVIDRVIKPAFGGDAVKFKYTADRVEMEKLSKAEPGRLGILMRPTPLQSVMDVSLADEVMPPKSTYFYPKLATGLVINPLR